MKFCLCDGGDVEYNFVWKSEIFAMHNALFAMHNAFFYGTGPFNRVFGLQHSATGLLKIQ